MAKLEFFLLVALTWSAALAQSSQRLPRNVLPRLYDVTLFPVLIEGNFTTQGTVDILVDCITSSNSITLHIADTIFDPSKVSVIDMTDEKKRIFILFKLYMVMSRSVPQ